MKENWVSYVLELLIIFVIAFPIIFFLGHYDLWRAIFLGALVGAVMVATSIWVDYRRKRIKE